MMNIAKRKGSPRMRAVLARVLLAVMLLAVVGGVLTSCGGGSTVAALVNQTINVEEGDGHGMSAEELNNLAADIKENKNGHTVREQLLAALNGYDMQAVHNKTAKENLPEAVPYEALLDPEQYPEGMTEEDIAAEKKKRVGYAVNALEEASIEVFAFEERMTLEDVESIVMCFRTTVELEESMGPIDHVLHWIALGFEWLIKVPGFGSFILGTVYFAIVVELLMLPLGIHQQKNSRKQAMLRPKEMAIRKKYAGRNDQVTQQKVNQEIQELYQREGFSPMAGCLPMLLSLPVIMALYYIVIDPLKYMLGASAELSSALTTFATASPAAGGLGIELGSNSGTIEVLSYIRDGLSIEGMASFEYFTNGAECVEMLTPMISRVPDFSLFGINFGLTPGFTAQNAWLLFIPVLTFTMYYLSMKLNRKLSYQPTTAQDPATGCSNKVMDIFMPGMSTFFTFLVPGAVGLYWAFKSILGMLKQFILSKVMPMPKFTEADYKAAERELAGKEKNKLPKKSGTKNPNIRSLHHIDDEDEDYGAPAPKKNQPYVEDESAPAEDSAPKTAGGAYGDGVTIKEDRPADKTEKKAKKLFGKKNKKDKDGE